MSSCRALCRFTLSWLVLCSAGVQTQTLTGLTANVGLPSPPGSTRPAAMKTAGLPATVVIVANGYALSTMGASDLSSAVLAGSPLEPGYYDAYGRDARFGEIADFALTRDGRVAYVADEANHCIRKVIIPASDLGTVSTFVGTNLGTVSTFVGTNVSGDTVGPLPAVRLETPSSVTLSPDGAYLYIADRTTSRLIKVDIAGGIASYLQFSYLSMTNWNYVPIALTMGSNPSVLFASASSNGIFQLSLQTSTATQLDFAAQNSPFLYVTSDTKYLFAIDATWNAVRVIDLTSGGSRWICRPTSSSSPPVYGDLDSCQLSRPNGITAVSSNTLYISDRALPNVTSLTFNSNFVLTTVRTIPPTTTSTTPAPTRAPPPMYTAKAPPTSPTQPLSFAPISNTTQSLRNASPDNSASSQTVALGVGLGVAFVVSLAFGLCVFFAIRDYRKNKRNPTTPFSRAVSFAVRSFRNSFGRGRFQRDGRQHLAESNGSLAENGSAVRIDSIGRAELPAAPVHAAARQQQPQPPRSAPAQPSAGDPRRQAEGGSSRAPGNAVSRQSLPAQPAASGRGAGTAGHGEQRRSQPQTYEALRPQADATRNYEPLKAGAQRPNSLSPGSSAGTRVGGEPQDRGVGYSGRTPDGGVPYGGAQPTSPSYKAPYAAAPASAGAPQQAAAAAPGRRFYGGEASDASGLYGQRTPGMSAEALVTPGAQRPGQQPRGQADLAASSYRAGLGPPGARSSELMLSPTGLRSPATGAVVANPLYGEGRAAYLGEDSRRAAGSDAAGEPLGGARSVNV